jgi:hypothetical protein
MPESNEKRHLSRQAIKRPFLYRSKSPISVKAGAGWTHNISEEGACLELPDRMEESSAFQILFQTDHGSLSIGVKVIWAAKIRERGGGIIHGVDFPGLSDEKRQALRDFIAGE